MSGYSFRFVTRTRYTDYKVYVDGGRETISNREGFRPLRQKCSITEGEQCVCIFQENSKIYLVVSALDRHKTDERGRAIRFSFCQIFTNEQQAASAFIKTADHFEDVEAWLSKNLHDINEGSEDEGVDLDEAAFMKWLIKDGEEFESDNWLEKGKVLKWTKRDGKENYIPIGEVFDPVNLDPADNYSDSKNSSKKKIIIAGATVLAGVVMCGCFVMGSKKKVQEIQNAAENKNNIALNISNDITSALPRRDFTPRDRQEIKMVVSKSLDGLKLNENSKDKENSSPPNIR